MAFLRRAHLVLGMNRKRLALGALGCARAVGVACVLAVPGGQAAQAQTFTGNAVTSGPFASGSQTFNDTSTLNAATENAVTGGTQTFNDSSTLNASVEKAVSAGRQFFYGNSSLNATAAGALGAGLVASQYFYDNSTLNASAAHALSGGQVISGFQTFYNASILNASAADAISGGQQTFRDGSTLNATVANAISGGSQKFYGYSILNASTADAISGGKQTFNENSTLNATVANAISGGSQNFYDASVLNVTVANAVSGGLQYFRDDTVVNASVANAISGGSQTFRNQSVLNISIENAVSGGKQYFYNTSALNASVENALAIGGWLQFNDSSTLNASGEGAISGGLQSFYGSSVLNASAVNAISGGTQAFDYTTVLNASAENAVSGGTQSFSGSSVLNATAANAVSGGTQNFKNSSTLKASTEYAVSGGQQNFYNTSVLNAVAEHAISGGTQGFSDTSVANATAANAISGGAQSFKNNSTLNASAEYALNGGTQTFFDTSTLNAAAGNAVSGGGQAFSGASTLNALAGYGVSGGVQQFSGTSVLNASAENAVSGGMQSFTGASALNALAGHALSGGVQTFVNTSALNASAENAVSGGEQSFTARSALNASAGNAVSGGEQVFNGSSSLNTLAAHAVGGGTQAFFETSALNASAENAVSGGTQSFTGRSALNASAAHAVSGGAQAFSGASALNASAENAVSGGEQVFNGSSALNASAAHAVSGGTQNFTDSSTLNAAAENAVNAGQIVFAADSSAQILVDNALSSDVGLVFSGHEGGVGGNMVLNGHNVAVGSIASDGAGAGRIFNNGAADAVLAVGNTALGNAIFSGQIADSNTDATGTLSLVKTSDNTLTLTGANSYTGGTTVAAGTLQLGDGGTSGMIVGDVVNDGALAFNRGDDVRFAGAISGSGSVRQIGAGTTVLTGTNSYSGGTLISAGTLQLGDGGTLGSITGDVVNDGALAFNRSDEGRFAGAISGSGAVRQIGDGTTVLTGANSYTGGTVISAGTLIGDASSFGTGGLDIAGALVLDQATDAVFANTLAGAGSFTKTGLGLVNLTGDSAGFHGATTIAAGTLAVNGTLGGVLDVTDAGRLQGTGMVGSTAVSGTIAPGNSIGTLTVAGDLLFRTGSFYEVEMTPTRADLVSVTGAATLEGGTVSTLKESGVYLPGSRWTILSAADGVSGTFAGLQEDMPYVDMALGYDDNHVYLDIARNDVRFCGFGFTRNQCATANGVESLKEGNRLYDIIASQTDETAPSAFDQLSGEIHASARTALIEESRFVREAATARLRSAFGTTGASTAPVTSYTEAGARLARPTTNDLAIWGQGYGSWGQVNGDGNAARLSASTGGFIGGADMALDTWRVGLLAGFSETSLHVDERNSSGDVQSFHLGAYGGTQWGALGLRSGLAYSWNDLDVSRSVVFPGLSETLDSGYDAGLFQAFGELGYTVEVGSVGLEPFANLAYVNLGTDGYAEKWGIAALSGSSQGADVTFTTLGVRISHDVDMAGIGGQLRATLGWQHAFGDIAPLASQRFSAGDVFTIVGVPIAQNAAFIEAGMDINVAPNALLSVNYNGLIASDAQQNGFNLRFRQSF